ncbi:MAG: DUF2141 domain-containing protein [Candidatus Omnitrophota bacterium]|nr:DUF2141 domain-containing protein [Candidatus Omnitrophota bacterium]
MNKKILSIAILIIVTVLVSALSIGAQDIKGTIHVKVTGILVKQGGNLIFALYNSESSWLVLKKIYASKAVKVTSDTVTAAFENIPYADSYALFVFHDAKGNNKLDFYTFPFPRPKEGVAVSNNAVRFGEPRYRQARFSINSPEYFMELKMHY